jgi:hypothetical protein
VWVSSTGSPKGIPALSAFLTAISSHASKKECSCTYSLRRSFTLCRKHLYDCNHVTILCVLTALLCVLTALLCVLTTPLCVLVDDQRERMVAIALCDTIVFTDDTSHSLTVSDTSDDFYVLTIQNIVGLYAQ